jgi:hypothetical protein
MCFGVLVLKCFERIGCCIGSILLGIERPPEDGTLVLKHVGVFFNIAYECILSSA